MKKFFVILFVLFSFRLFSRDLKGLNVVVPSSDLENISQNYLGSLVKDRLKENLQKYIGVNIVADESLEKKIKQLQRMQEATSRNQNEIVKLGNLSNARFVCLSTIRKVKNQYHLTVDFVDLQTGISLAIVNANSDTNENTLIKDAGVIDSITLQLCEKLNITINNDDKYILTYGKRDLSLSELHEVEKIELEKLNKRQIELDEELRKLNNSTNVNVENEIQKYDALKKLNEQKIQMLKKREDTLLEDLKRREKDKRKDFERSELILSLREKKSKEINEKIDIIRKQKKDNLTVFEQIDLLEKKKQIFGEINNDAINKVVEVRNILYSSIKEKQEEIRNKPFRAGELSHGKPVEEAQLKRQNELDEIYGKYLTEVSSEIKKIFELNYDLCKDIIKEYSEFENTEYVISSLTDEYDFRYSVGDFDALTKQWPVTFYFSNFEYSHSIYYESIIKNNQSNDEYLDTVDLYNSMFARKIPFLEFELVLKIDYLCGTPYLSGKKINIKNTSTSEIVQVINLIHESGIEILNSSISSSEQQLIDKYLILLTSLLNSSNVSCEDYGQAICVRFGSEKKIAKKLPYNLKLYFYLEDESRFLEKVVDKKTNLEFLCRHSFNKNDLQKEIKNQNKNQEVKRFIINRIREAELEEKNAQIKRELDFLVREQEKAVVAIIKEQERNAERRIKRAYRASVLKDIFSPFTIGVGMYLEASIGGDLLPLLGLTESNSLDKFSYRLGAGYIFCSFPNFDNSWYLSLKLECNFFSFEHTFFPKLMFGKRWKSAWFLGDQSYLEFGGGPKIKISDFERVSSGADLGLTYGIDFYKDIGLFVAMNFEVGLELNFSMTLGFRFGLVNEW